MTRGHRTVDHTADVAFEAWAPTEVALLEEAARAVVELMTESATIEAGVERPVRIEAVDAEDRLVAWLNEVIYLATVEGQLVRDLDGVLSGSDLEGTIRVEADARAKVASELKSATYFDLRLDVGPEGASAHVVLDV